MFQFFFSLSLYKLAAAYAITHAVPPSMQAPLLLSSWYSWTIQLLGAVSEEAGHPTAWKCPTGGIRAPYILVTPDKAARLKQMETTSLFTSIYSSYPTNSNDFDGHEYARPITFAAWISVMFFPQFCSQSVTELGTPKYMAADLPGMTLQPLYTFRVLLACA